jgi:CxxC-x17-CxxC domain-containing protein
MSALVYRLTVGWLGDASRVAAGGTSFWFLWRNTVGQYEDRSLACRDCGKQFTFTAGEQEFYASRGFSEPTRCSECRAARKASRDSGDYGSRGGYGSDHDYGSSRGGGYGSSRSQGGARQMFQAVCADCGTTTEVPFEPRQGRPVYCRDCFEKRNPRR